ncbi:uncharacterized protein LOC128840036 [Malaclemys terrapin pileata]|uniref:uncharacterized protein LOC128840036 n=1 Tax=Malaclemys terrapin pileata TaxID=2991368 RepID=UPI0023A8A632|nr:uncharacterized protein LOC128840036 [Malaclemys terrapin pileata]
MPEDSADGKEEEEEEKDELAVSTQHSVLPNSQDLFLSLTEVPSQGVLPDHEAMEGTSAAKFSSVPPPSRRLSQIRRRKKRRRDDMFSEIMQSTHDERAHLNEWKDMVSKYRKDASEREAMRDAQVERWQAAMLGLLCDQTDMLRHLMELQERQQDHRVPLQPLYNYPPPSPCSIASSPRRPRTRGEAPCTLPLHPSGQPKQKAVIILNF